MTKPPKERRPASIKQAEAGDDICMEAHDQLINAGIHGAVGIDAWSKLMGEPNLVELIRSVRGKIDLVVDENDQKPIEAILMVAGVV